MSGNVSPDWNTHGQCGWCAGSGISIACWCTRCHGAKVVKLTALDALTVSHMHLCPDCGNKRCPRATNHENACTGSNEPGQAGSRYGGLPL